MRVWFLIAATSGLLFLWIRYALGRVSRAPWRTTVVAAIAVAPLVWLEWQWQQTITEANAVVRLITARPDAAIECQRFSAALLYARGDIGYVEWQDRDERGTGDTAFLTYDICHELRQWLNGDKSRPTRDQMIAVHVLTHEAMHVAGFRSEAETECQAMAWNAVVAEQLGATPEQAAAMSRLYAAEEWPRLRSNYRADCADFPMWDPATTVERSSQ